MFQPYTSSVTDVSSCSDQNGSIINAEIFNLCYRPAILTMLMAKQRAIYSDIASTLSRKALNDLHPPSTKRFTHTYKPQEE